MRGVKIIIFGTGRFLKDNLHRIDQDDIQAYIDNDTSKWGEEIEGNTIYRPKGILNLEYDYVVVMCAKEKDRQSIREQLSMLGIPDEKIWSYGDYLKFKFAECYTYVGSCEKVYGSPSVLIITSELKYNGGAVAAINAAIALKNRGYYVVISTPYCDMQVKKEIETLNMLVIEAPSIPYITGKETWLDGYDYYIVNAILMIRCAALLRDKRMMWWLHDPSYMYPMCMEEFSTSCDVGVFRRIMICAVSNVAKNNFEHYFPQCVNDVMPLGIRDDGEKEKNISEKIIFAQFGPVCELKNQLEVIKAFQQIKKNGKIAELWLVGAILDSEYARQVVSLSLKDNSIHLLGECTRETIQKLYREIDVVVCASKEETLSMAIVEGMMHSTVCIATERAGIREYCPKEGEIIFYTNDENGYSLRKVMEEIISQWGNENIQSMRKRARRRYESFFTLEALGKRLENVFTNL